MDTIHVHIIAKNRKDVHKKKLQIHIFNMLHKH